LAKAIVTRLRHCIRCQVHICGNHFRTLEYVWEWCEKFGRSGRTLTKLEDFLNTTNVIPNSQGQLDGELNHAVFPIDCPTGDVTMKLLKYFEPWAMNPAGPHAESEENFDSAMMDESLIFVKSRTEKTGKVQAYVSLPHLYEGTQNLLDDASRDDGLTDIVTNIPLRCVNAIGHTLRAQRFGSTRDHGTQFEQVFLSALLFRLYVHRRYQRHSGAQGRHSNRVPLHVVLPGCFGPCGVREDIEVSVEDQPIMCVSGTDKEGTKNMCDQALRNSTPTTLFSQWDATLANIAPSLQAPVPHPGPTKGIEAVMRCWVGGEEQPRLLLITCKFIESGAPMSAFGAARRAAQEAHPGNGHDKPSEKYIVLGVAPHWKGKWKLHANDVVVPADTIRGMLSVWGAFPLMSRTVAISSTYR
jgi:hypothetical protein